MEIENKKTGQRVEVSPEEWGRMQANELWRKYRVIDATTKQAVHYVSKSAPVEVIDFLKDKDTAVHIEQPKRRKGRGIQDNKAGIEVTTSEAVDPPTSVAAGCSEPAPDNTDISFEDLEFTDQIVS